MKSSKHRPDSLATIHLEDLFGPISLGSRENSSKFYPSTVPQPKVPSKSFGLTNNDSFDDDIKPMAFSSANLIKGRRRSNDLEPSNKK